MNFRFFKTSQISNPLVDIESLINLTDIYPDVDFFTLAEMRIRNGDIKELPDLIKFMNNSIDTDWAGYPSYMFIKYRIKFTPITTSEGYHKDIISEINFPVNTDDELIKKLTNGFKISIGKFYRNYLSLEHSEVEELDSKIRIILKKWNCTNIEKFIQNVKKDITDETDDNMIILNKLRDRRNEIENLRQRIPHFRSIDSSLIIRNL